MNDTRIEQAAFTLLEMFQVNSERAVVLSPLTLATAALAAADKVDPLRMNQTAPRRGLPNGKATQ